jgi:hypothetical protein
MNSSTKTVFVIQVNDRNGFWVDDIIRTHCSDCRQVFENVKKLKPENLRMVRRVITDTKLVDEIPKLTEESDLWKCIRNYAQCAIDRHNDFLAGKEVESGMGVMSVARHAWGILTSYAEYLGLHAPEEQSLTTFCSDNGLCGLNELHGFLHDEEKRSVEWVKSVLIKENPDGVIKTASEGD